MKQYVNNQERNKKFIYTRQVNSKVSSEDVNVELKFNYVSGLITGGRCQHMMMMMMMNFIHVSMYLADANWGHNIKIK